MLPSTIETAPKRSGDPLFGVLTGVYLALLATPLVAFAAVRAGMSGSGVLYGVVLVTLTVVTGLGWLATSRAAGVDTRLGGSRLRWLPGIAPAALVLLGFASLAATGVVGFLGFFFGMFATIVGFVLGVMARTRHTLALTEGVDPDCEFTAGWPERARRRVHLVAGLVVAATFLGFVFGSLTERWLLQITSQMALSVGIVLGTWGQERTYVASEVGVEQRMPVARRLFPWADFTGYTRTDDAIVLHRPRGIDFRFALADLDDPDAVERALGTHLSPS
ncbi:hypothetical protein [Haloarcula nitratireducens]|uniref:DUF5673 domain-containing protein n=1 Tax=Haloarcula nitratireducens TaxID=2487749 RepID=A0AAW4PAL1_9EURY|nr:hypothetical protein [Halomicroarcula nitratireducens]MBX0294848.1 hypothetical protein [Halomicroarcula nitratireducens]